MANPVTAPTPVAVATRTGMKASTKIIIAGVTVLLLGGAAFYFFVIRKKSSSSASLTNPTAPATAAQFSALKKSLKTANLDLLALPVAQLNKMQSQFTANLTKQDADTLIQKIDSASKGKALAASDKVDVYFDVADLYKKWTGQTLKVPTIA